MPDPVLDRREEGLRDESEEHTAPPFEALMMGGRTDHGERLTVVGFQEADPTTEASLATLEAQSSQKRLELHPNGQGVIIQVRKGSEACRETVVYAKGQKLSKQTNRKSCVHPRTTVVQRGAAVLIIMFRYHRA